MTLLRAPDQDVAVKLLDQATYKDATAIQKKALEDMFQAEVRVLSRFRHPNLVRLLGYAQGDAGEGQLALVYELVSGGSLKGRLLPAPGKATLTKPER